MSSRSQEIELTSPEDFFNAIAEVSDDILLVDTIEDRRQTAIELQELATAYSSWVESQGK